MKLLKLISLIILTLSSLCEALDELGVVEIIVKSHHGLILFGVVQSISAFQEFIEKSKEIRN
ncbi:hypothetical protein N8595_00505 [bacterium]|jgi:hypothetical protein|nr:hypothetical protein [bacterium]MDA7884043.1 hypothetical protein [Akkermansiaceae bacterium]MDB4527537.1 hypothetical protein [Akkermansiaceae bacterium]|tara:strand:- start:338 stop:523 length:186 start_codon:yes stop_codon:yes gene_type:complete